MTYLDKRLATGEEPIRREHQHWFVVAADARYSIFAFIGAIVLIFLSGLIPNEDIRKRQEIVARLARKTTGARRAIRPGQSDMRDRRGIP